MKRAILLPTFLLGLSCSIHASHTRYPVRRPYPATSPAYELEAATGSLRRDAEYALRGRSRYDRNALNEIRKLHDRARDYRRNVDRRYQDGRRSRRDLDRLTRQYYRAESALRYAYTPRQLYRSLSYVRRLLSQLQRRYTY
jgi:hypothetical protein